MAKEKSGKEKIDKARLDGNKEAALASALAKIEKDFGRGTIMKLGDKADTMNIEVASTGCISVDMALGVGGLPKGRIIEIYGPEASGKTTLALHAVASVQKAGGVASFVDAEHALDPVYAASIGVDTAELYISQPDNGEQALDITEMMVRSGAIDIIVVDSVAALVPKSELEGEMGEANIGLQARLMSKALRKLTGIVSKTNCIVIFINQLREKVGSMYGPSETTTGGKSLKYYASVRIDVRRTDAIKQGTELIGNRTKIKIVKNKVAPPFKEVFVDIIYGKGISLTGDILDIATDDGLIKKSGSWYSYEGQKIGQGRENAKEFLESHPEIRDSLYKTILEKVSVSSSAKEDKEDADIDEPIDFILEDLSDDDMSFLSEEELEDI